MDGADRTAAAYGRRRPRFPVIPETVGVALVMLVSRNIVRHQCLHVIHPYSSDAVCAAAEAWATAVTGHRSPDGWRDGALASLRTLAGRDLREHTRDWPARNSTETIAVPAAWLDVGQVEFGNVVRVRTLPEWLVPHLPVDSYAGPAFDALLARYEDGRGYFAAFSSGYERPADTRRLRELVVGR